MCAQQRPGLDTILERAGKYFGLIECKFQTFSEGTLG